MIIGWEVPENDPQRDDTDPSGHHPGAPTGRPTLIGSNPALRAAVARGLRVADGVEPILVRGESGTGRKQLARYIHSRSRRAGKPFVLATVSHAPDSLIELELFGQGGEGSPAGPVHRRGRFEHAAGGTLFLAGLGRTATRVLASLERVFGSGLIEPFGGGPAIPVDARVIAGTRENPGTQRGARIDELFSRFGIVIELPPLRERGDDRFVLARHYISYYARLHRRPVPALSDSARALIASYWWPGNIRQLRHAMERGVLLAEKGTIHHHHILAL